MQMVIYNTKILIAFISTNKRLQTVKRVINFAIWLSIRARAYALASCAHNYDEL